MFVKFQCCSSSEMMDDVVQYAHICINPEMRCSYNRLLLLSSSWLLTSVQCYVSTFFKPVTLVPKLSCFVKLESVVKPFPSAPKLHLMIRLQLIRAWNSVPWFMLGPNADPRSCFNMNVYGVLVRCDSSLILSFMTAQSISTTFTMCDGRRHLPPSQRVDID